MLENIKYVNHLGESFSNADGIRVVKSKLRNFKWHYDMKGNGVRRFKRETDTVDVPVTLMVVSDDADEVKNRIFAIAEKDVLANEAGRLYINDYYLSGFVVESKKSGYTRTKYLLQNDIEFLALNRGWIREQSESFYPRVYEDVVIKQPFFEEVTEGEESKELNRGILYPEFKFDYVKKKKVKKIYPLFGFPFDFVHKKTARHMMNDSIGDSHFKLTIYGFANNPEIMINGHVYGVNAIVYEGERIEIDSYKKTVTKIGRLGEETNLFNQRYKEQSVFDKLPAGMLSIIWSEAYQIDLTIYDERSEPAWS